VTSNKNARHLLKKWLNIYATNNGSAATRNKMFPFYQQGYITLYVEAH